MGNYKFTEVSLNECNRLFNHGPVALISCGDETDTNIMPAAWNMPVSKSPPLYAVAIAPGRYTMQLIRKNGDFVVNLPTRDEIDKLMITGSKSGQGIDKFEKSGFEKYPSRKVRTPGILQSLSHLECRFLHAHREGDHELVIGEVVYADALEGAFDRVWQKSPESIHHLGDQYFCITGERIEYKGR